MPADTRTSLIQAATGLLTEAGLAAVTLRDVGTRAGLSRSAPYRHFEGKDDLLAAVATAALHELQEEVVGAVRRAPPGRTRLQRALLAHLRFAAARPSAYGLAFGGEVSSPTLTEAVERVRATLVALVAEAAPWAPEPQRLAAIVFSAVHGAALLAATGQLGGEEASRDVARDLVLLVTTEDPRGS